MQEQELQQALGLTPMPLRAASAIDDDGRPSDDRHLDVRVPCACVRYVRVSLSSLLWSLHISIFLLSHLSRLLCLISVASRLSSGLSGCLVSVVSRLVWSRVVWSRVVSCGPPFFSSEGSMQKDQTRPEKTR